MCVPLETRTEKLVTEYGALDKDFLTDCTMRVRKRLGPEQTRDAIQAINEDRMADFIRLLLVYYDKTYQKGLSTRLPGQVFTIDCDNTETVDNALKIKDFAYGNLVENKIEHDGN